MTRTSLIALAGFLLLASPAVADPLPVSTIVNADIVVNHNGITNYDTDQSDADSVGFAYATQSAVSEFGAPCSADADGLPDDGIFPATDRHPQVQLLTDNPHQGLNAYQLLAHEESLPAPLDVPDDRYVALHVFAASGNGDADLEAVLDYEDGSSDVVTINVLDWAADPPEDDTRYDLIDGLDRMASDASSCEDGNDFAIFGLVFPVDPAKTLTAVELTRRDNLGTTVGSTKLNVFGAILIPMHDVTVTKTGAGNGTVTGPDIDCGSDCSQPIADERVMTLTATPSEGSTFEGWSGECGGSTATTCDVFVNENKTVTARFEPVPPSDPLAGQQPPPGGGQQQPAPGGGQQPPDLVQTIGFGSLLTAPAAARCVPRLRLRLKTIAGTTISSVRVRVGSRRPRTVSGRALTRRIVFRSLPRGEFTVRITATTADGRTLVARRTYRRCPKPRRRRARGV